MMKFVLGLFENIVGKEKMLVTSSPFPTLFSKDFFQRIIDNCDCVLKSEKAVMRLVGYTAEKILDLSEFKAFPDIKLGLPLRFGYCISERVNYEKKEKC